MLGVPSTRDLRCHGGHSAVAVNAGVKIPTSGLGGLIRRRVRAGTGERVALIEPVAVAVHLQDMDVMGEPSNRAAADAIA